MVRKRAILPNQVKFDWNEGNLNKNRLKHGVGWEECEEFFFNKPLIVSEDSIHPTVTEKRFRVLGKTNNGRLLFIVFTLRGNKIRVISARDQNKKEKTFYKGGEAK